MDLLDQVDEHRTEERPGIVKRHRALVVLLVLVGLLLALVGGWAVYLNKQLSDVPRVDLGLNEDTRPERPAGQAGEAVNILLAGTDSGDGRRISEAVGGDWQPGEFRSDTIMVLHVTGDREKAYLVSIPRDTWVTIDGYGQNKINAAFSFGGPSLYVQTIEQFTGMRMDHLAIIDWTGFRDLTTALGGITVQIPENVSGIGDQQWTAGEHTLQGDEALRYVRTRYGLPNGDFDRIKRQQNFLRATMAKLLAQGTFANPVRLTNSVEAITEHLVLDEEFDNSELRSLALDARGIRLDDVTFVTIPVDRLDRISGQSVVIHDEAGTKELFGAVMADEMEEYLRRADADVLQDPGSVS